MRADTCGSLQEEKAILWTRHPNWPLSSFSKLGALANHMEVKWQPRCARAWLECVMSRVRCVGQLW